MNPAALLRKIDEIDRISDQEWRSSLDERKQKEMEFHDQHRDRTRDGSLDHDTYERLYGNKKYYASTELSKRYVDEWIASHAAGKVFLDYACGNGENAIKAAEAGASLSLGFDLSAISVANARQAAEVHGVANRTRFFQADAENTMLPAASIDLVICSGMLHHLDLTRAFPELHRILKPGGTILGVEALDYNPAIKLYRYLTPAMRTDWEKAHILSLRDLDLASQCFEVANVRYWHVASIFGAFVPRTLPLLNAVDAMITRVPGLQLMAWMFTFELRARHEKAR